MSDTQTILHHCLYFTANALSRVITRMAEESFRSTGLSPSHAFLMMLVNDQPGIGQKELCAHLQLAPSTVTRFVDALVHKGYITRQSDGKASRVYATDRGRELQTTILASWKDLYDHYSAVLGKRRGDELAVGIDKAVVQLSRDS